MKLLVLGVEQTPDYRIIIRELNIQICFLHMQRNQTREIENCNKMAVDKCLALCYQLVECRTSVQTPMLLV